MPRTFFSRTFGNNTGGGGGGGSPPSPAVLSVVDNGDGTGGVATINGSPATSHTLFMAPANVASPTWEEVDDRSGDGTIAIAHTTGGLFWFYVLSENGDGIAASNVVLAYLTSEDELLLPIVERIALQLIARLESVTTDNGYHQDVASVERPNRSAGVVPDHLMIIVEQPDAVRAPEYDFPGNPPVVGWQQNFELHLIVRQSETATVADDQTANIFAADVSKAISNPQLSWANWSGLAVDSQLAAPVTYEPSEGAFSGMTVSLTIWYRHPENDPYTPR